MIVALFGRSCCGKTALASRSAASLGIPVRHCGDAVRDAARAVAVSIDDLPLEEHQKVDRETKDWARLSQVALLDGRFLQYVLSGFGAPLFLVEVTGSAAARSDRWAKRLGRAFDEEALMEMDQGDDRLTHSLYPSIVPSTPDLVIDTTSLPIDECVQQLTAAMSRIGIPRVP